MSSSHPKIQISHAYRSDFTMVQQEADRAIAEALKQIDFSNNEQLKTVAERRLQQFFLSSGARFRNHVQYAKEMGKNNQRIIMQADTNLQKINQIKCGMLKESLLKIQRQKWPQIQIPINVSVPLQLEVKQAEGLMETEEQTMQRIQNQLPSHFEDFKKILQLQNLAATALKRLEAQEKLDKQYFCKK